MQIKQTNPEWCKTARKRLIDLGITQYQLSDKVSLSRQYVSSILSGKIYSEAAIHKISKELGIREY